MSRDMYAFPMRESVRSLQGEMVEVTTPGMTLRDWFAGQALAGMCANPMALNAHNMSGAIDRLARDAFALADALMKERGTR